MSQPLAAVVSEVDRHLPLVSILIPAWGCKPFIGETIRSALAQSYPNFEVIVVEDAGHDGTYEEALQFKDPRLTVVRNEHNLGQYANKNRAMELAKGTLLKFLDADDLLVDDAISTLVTAWRASGPGTGLVLGQFDIVDTKGLSIGRPSAWGAEGRRSGREVLAQVLKARLPGSRFGNTTPHLFERSTLEQVGRFPNDNAGPGDLDTFLRLLCVTDVAFTERTTARYRVHASSMSSRTFGVKECGDYVRMVDRFEEYCRRLAGLPAFLQSARFFRDWRVWSGGHNIFASLQLKMRGRPNQYNDLQKMYAGLGLAHEFAYFVRTGLPAYVLRTLATKGRRMAGLRDAGRLLR